MYRLHTLGTIDLRADDGRVVHSVLAQPKRLGLLAYLAAERPGSFHQRETVTALFWPNRDDEHARSALRQNLYQLRRSLGPGVLAGTGKEVLSIEEEHLWCDAAALEKALATGDHRQALELYQGEFLPGLHVADAPAFEEWLQQKRLVLRRGTARAAWTMVTTLEDEKDGASALRWARRAVELDDASETAWRRLITVLLKQGDRLGADRAYRQLRERLEELGLDPDAETEALMERGTDRPPAPPPERGGAGNEATPGEGTPTVVPVEPASPPASAPVPPEPASTLPAAPEPARTSTGRSPIPEGILFETASLRWLFRSRTASLTIAFLLLAAAIGVFRSSGPTGSPSAGSPDRIAVFPFRVDAHEEGSFLATAVMELLSAQLDGMGGLRCVDPASALNLSAAESGGELPPVRARRLARQLDAGYFVLGSIVSSGTALRATARLYGPDGAALGTARATAPGPTDLFEAADELARQLLAIFPHRTADGIQIEPEAVHSTRSLAAYRYYLAGESMLRTGRWESAAVQYREAIAEDPGFGLAWYRLSRASDSWGTSFRATRDAADSAMAYSERLPPRDRRRLEAWREYLAGNAPEALRLYRSLIRSYPNDVEAWSELARIQLHFGFHPAIDPGEALEGFRRVRELAPGDAVALTRGARAARILHRHEMADSLLREALEEGLAEPHEDLTRVLLAASRGGAEASSVPTLIQPLDDVDAVAAVVSLGLVGPDAVAAGAPALLQSARSAVTRRLGHLFLAQADMARGRWSDARQRMAEGDDPLTFATRTLSAAAPWLPEDATDPTAELAVLPPLLPSDGRVDAGPLDPLAGAREVLGLYLRGLLLARQGRADSARALEGLLRGAASPPELPSLARDLARGVTAALHFRDGDTTAAAAALEGIRLRVVYPAMHTSAIATQAHSRYLMGRALAARGQDEDALRWFSTFDVATSPFELPYQTVSYYRRGMLYERLGHRDRAVEMYDRFATLWVDADPELRPLSDHAERRILALSAR